MKDYPTLTNIPGQPPFSSQNGRVPTIKFDILGGGIGQGGITPPFLEAIENAVLLSLVILVVLGLFEVWGWRLT